jgi:transcriptional regulator of heat shock response
MIWTSARAISFRRVVDHYLTQGEPLGSRTLSRDLSQIQCHADTVAGDNPQCDE